MSIGLSRHDRSLFVVELAPIGRLTEAKPGGESRRDERRAAATAGRPGR